MKYLLLFAAACGAAAQSKSVLSILPADGATGVPLNARVLVTVGYGSYFQAPFKITKAGITVSGATQTTTNSFGISPPAGASTWFQFTPDKLLDPNTTYKVEVDSPSSPPFFASFTTDAASDNTPLQLVSSTPSPGQDGVSVFGSMTLRFNKPVSPYSFQQGQFRILDLATGGLSGGYFGPQAQPDGSTLVFPFVLGIGDSVLALGHAYQFQFPSSGVTDWLGNPLAPVPDAIPFNTLRAPEKTGPVLIGTVPADGDAGVSLNSSIVLVFDKPLAQTAWDSTVTLDSGGPLKFKLDNTLAGGRALVIQPALLMAPNSQVSVNVSGLLDQFGAALAAPIHIGFRTGAAVETRQLLLNPPVNAPLPQNAPIRATFNRALDPLLLSLGSVKISPYQDTIDLVTVPSLLSDDGRTLTFNPSSPLPPGSYQASISVPFDRTAGKLSPFPMYFTVTGDIDSTPPQVLAVTPPDGTPDAPLNSVIQVAFSEPVVASSGATSAFQLLENGNPVAGAFSLSGSQGTFFPKGALDPSAAYQISVAGVSDLAGNALPAFSASFTTAASSSTDKFQVSGIAPQSNTVADPSSPIVVTFNRTLDPVSIYSNAQFRVSSNILYSVPGQFQVDGAVLTFTPASPFTAGRWVVSVNGISDLAGNVVAPFSSVFSVTGAASDSTPPAVISVSPPDGQTVLFQNPYVVFTFSKPIDPNTLNSVNIVGYGPNGYIPLKLTALPGFQQVAVTFSANPGTLVTLIVTSGVADLAGNSAALFRTTVRMSDRPNTTGTAVVAQRPGYTSNNIPPNTGITLLFNGPVDRPSVEQGLLVTANGNFVPGKVDWSPDSQGLTFVPFSPFPYSSSVNIAIVSPAQDALGNPVTYNGQSSGSLLKIADAPPAPPASLAVVASNQTLQAGTRSPLDTVIELQFNQDVPAAFGVGSLTENSTGSTQNQVISCTAALVRPRVIRFTPQSLLRPNDGYTFNFDSGNGLKWSSVLWTGNAVAASNPAVVAAGPVDRSAALNAQVTVAFSSPVPVFTMPVGLTLSTGGTAVPARYTWNAGGQALTLIPLALLHADTDYTVSMAGFEDLAGHSIADRTWTFHTSNGIDLRAPAVLSVDPSGGSVSAGATVTVRFSEPVAADWIDRFTVNDAGAIQNTSAATISGSIQLSGDQQTLFFTPAQHLAAGHYYSINVPLADDFAGNVPDGPWYATTAHVFQVGFSALPAPSVVMATPDDGSSGLPLNAQFQAQFDQAVQASSLDGVTLLEGGMPLPATVRLEADGRTVTAFPQRLPAAGSTVQFLVAGVKNTDGVAMAGGYQASVQIGQGVDTIAPVYRSSPGLAQVEVPVSAGVRLRFNEPLNKLTVSARNIGLARIPFGAAVDVTVALQDSGRTVVITPSNALEGDTSYSVFLSGVSDLSGNLVDTSFNQGQILSFSTASGASTPLPVVLAFDPPDGSQNLPPNAKIQLLYSQPVDLTQGDRSLQLWSGDTPVPGTLGGINGQLIFTPARPLADGAHRVQASGITDVSGNPLDPVSSQFTVAALGNSAPFKLLSSTPAALAVGVPVTAAITLNFSKTVSTVSAAALQISSQGVTIPGTFQVQDSVVTFTPSAALPGAARISVSGTVRDLWGFQAGAYLDFTTDASPDVTPPTVTFAYPSEGSVVPAYGTNIVLQFSKPVTAASGTTPVRILAGANPAGNIYGPQLGEDSQTIGINANLPPDTDITVAVTSDLTDFAGNHIQPVSIHFRTGSDAAAHNPQVLSVSPANGAVNVDANSPVVLSFSHVMVPASVGVGLQVTEAGVAIAGSTSGDGTAQVFTFQPLVPYQPGSTVELFAGTSIFDSAGLRITPFAAHFTTLAPQTATGQAVSFSASANAIDVRFRNGVPSGASQTYLRKGTALVPAEIVPVSSDQIRVLPTHPLASGAVYHLVLDAAQELLIQVDQEADNRPGEATIVRGPGRIEMQFSRPVNPLTVLRGGVRLLGADGAPVSYTTQTSLDRTKMVLTPFAAGPVTVVIDGVESRTGWRLKSQTQRF